LPSNLSWAHYRREDGMNLQRLVLTFKPDALEILDVERGMAA
jgi:hypothetical protein